MGVVVVVWPLYKSAHVSWHLHPFFPLRIGGFCWSHMPLLMTPVDL